MSYLQATKRPAQGFEIIEDVVDLLQAVTTLTDALGSSAYIYEHRAPEPVGGQWKRVVVREPIRGTGTRVNAARLRGIRFDVMVEVQEQVEKPDQFLAQAHDVIFQNLVGQVLTLSRGSAIMGIQAYSSSTVAGYDANDHSYYSTAGYVIPTLPA